MGLILPQEVEVGLSSVNISWYEGKGYSIPRVYKNGKFSVSHGTKITVNVLDLQLGSHIIVKAKCDCCNEIFNVKYKAYNINRKKSNRTYCKGCSLKDIQKENKHEVTGIYKWSDRKYALEQLNAFIKKNGTLKGFTVNNKEGSRINASLKNNGYNIEELCAELGYNYLNLKGLYYPVGYLDDFNNFKNIINEFINTNNYFPSVTNLKHDLHIPESIYRKHGTMNELKKLIIGDKSNLLEDDRGFYNRSHYEYMVAQFLIHNNVDYLREQFPFPKPYNMLRSDFTFFDCNNSFHVELWGYYKSDDATSRSCQYNLKRKEKELLYNKYNIRLISINPETFNASIDEIQNRLTDIFTPYIKLKMKHIDNDYMINPNKLSDEEIINKFMEYSDDHRFLPKQNILQKETPTLFNEMNRRYGNQNNFAKKYNKLTYSKFGLWDKTLIIRIFMHMQTKYGYVLKMSEIKKSISNKSDSMLIGFNDGLKKVFGNIIDGYLFYYDYCLRNKINLHNNDLNYLRNLSMGRYFNSKNATENRKIKAKNILEEYYNLAYFEETT
jgi:hypothetical protein